MKHLRQWTALLLALVLLFTLTACSGKKSGKTEKTEASSSDVRLPYSREDGVNPFTAVSLMNQPVMPLLYEGLFYMNSSYEPVPEIAESATFGGGNLVVRLRSGARFSDGSQITPTDVIYSFTRAKKSTYYGTALTMFTSASTTELGSVAFRLAYASKYAAADLTFPIVKSGTADKGDNIPVGSGPYCYSVSNMGGVLKKNENNSSVRSADKNSSGSHHGSINQIFLTNVSDTATLMSNLAIGNINAVYDDLAAGPVTRVQANYGKMPMNNIVVVKMRGNGALGNAKIRQDISALLDRSALVETGLNGYGIPSTLPYNPHWYVTKGIKVPAINKDKAKSQLQKAFKGKTLSILTDASNPFKVNLATELQKQLKSMGISSSIASVNYDGYAKAAGGSGYDFIIAEYKLTNDMNLSAAMPDKPNLKLYQKVLTGEITPQKYCQWYLKQMPYLTLAYRSGLLAYSKDLGKAPHPLPDNPYADAWQWEVH